MIEKFLKKLYNLILDAGVAQLVEHQPSKLRVAGSIPVSRSKFENLIKNDFSIKFDFRPCRFRTTGFIYFGSGPRSSVGRAHPW